MSSRASEASRRIYKGTPGHPRLSELLEINRLKNHACQTHALKEGSGTLLFANYLLVRELGVVNLPDSKNYDGRKIGCQV